MEASFILFDISDLDMFGTQKLCHCVLKRFLKDLQKNHHLMCFSGGILLWFNSIHVKVKFPKTNENAQHNVKKEKALSSFQGRGR